VELAGPDDASFRGILEGRALEIGSGARVVSRGEGTLSGPGHPPPPDPEAGEPH
jgi:hypothetical protein